MQKNSSKVRSVVVPDLPCQSTCTWNSVSRPTIFCRVFLQSIMGQWVCSPFAMGAVFQCDGVSEDVTATSCVLCVIYWEFLVVLLPSVFCVAEDSLWCSVFCVTEVYLWCLCSFCIIEDSLSCFCILYFLGYWALFVAFLQHVSVLLRNLCSVLSHVCFCVSNSLMRSLNQNMS